MSSMMMRTWTASALIDWDLPPGTGHRECRYLARCRQDKIDVGTIYFSRPRTCATRSRLESAVWKPRLAA